MAIENILPLLSLVPNVDLVTRNILIDGIEVPGKYQFTNVSIQSEINRIPTASLVLMDCSDKMEDAVIASVQDFKPGKKIEIKLGYHNNNETVFKGIIIKNSPRISGQCMEMTIECKDETIKMTVTKNNNYFNDITDSDIAKQLLDNNGIRDIDVTETKIMHEQLVQQNSTDWDFMISRIDVNGLMCIINNSRLSIRKPVLDEQAKLSLSHGSTILDFKVDMDSRIQSDKVTTYVWDFDKQDVNVVDSDKFEIEDGQTDGANIEELAGVISKPYEMRTSYLSAAEQKEVANAKKVKQILSKIKGRVKYIGVTSVLPGDFLSLNGVGGNFNGRAFVSAIQHEYADGDWTTEATLGWNENFFSETVNSLHPASATGQMSFVQGLQSAIVTKITDETGQYRVKIKLPLVDNDTEGIYARVATLDAGDKRGTFFRPEIGDEVVVGFMNDDPRNPVILGMMHSSKKSAPLEPEDVNDQKGYVSRSRIKMIFDDGKKSILIETPGGRTIKLDDDADEITIEDNHTNKIVMDASGISIESAKDLILKANKSISVSAPQISLKAQASLTAEASGAMNIKSSGITEIKGSIVKIN